MVLKTTRVILPNMIYELSDHLIKRWFSFMIDTVEGMMSEEFLPLTDEQLAQYESVINKIRASKKYKKFEKIRNAQKNEYKVAIAENKPVNFSKKQEKERKKLIQSIFADFEKSAKDIPGATKNKPQSKQNIFQKIFKRNSTDYYVPYHVEMAFWKELEQPGTFRSEHDSRVNNVPLTSHRPISKEKIAEIRGTRKTNNHKQDKTQNPYKYMNSEKFAFAVRAAYDNLACLQKNGWNSENDKNLVLADVQSVLNEAQSRYPNISKTLSGEFFKDKDIANLENQLFPILKEVSKTDAVAMQDVKNYENWRHNQNSVNGIIAEEPFQNKARYCAGGEYGNFKSPIQVANSKMTRNDMAIEKAKVAKLMLK